MEDFVYWLIGTLTAITAVIFTALYLFNSKKYTVLQLARDTKKDADDLASRLAEANEKTAIGVKRDMKDHIGQLVSVLKQDIDFRQAQTYSKIDLIDMRLAQVKIDLMEHIINEKDERSRMQKSIEFLQTMAWGADAKSIPPYMLGQEQTQEHKDEPDIGAFYDKDDKKKNGWITKIDYISSHKLHNI